MPKFCKTGHSRTVRAERAIAVAAVGLAAVAFTHPQVLSLAGLDFAQPVAVAQAVDPLPTGSLPSTDNARPPQIHGLAGTLKPLRNRN